MVLHALQSRRVARVRRHTPSLRDPATTFPSRTQQSVFGPSRTLRSGAGRRTLGSPRAFAKKVPTMLAKLSPLGKARPHELNLVTYNVLCSSLCAPTYFKHCPEDHLDPKRRLDRVLAALDEHVSRNAVICLQEVSTLWVGRLHAFFQERDYHLVHSSYARAWQGYMGCALAFPNATYAADAVEVVRVSDTKKGRWPRPPQPTMLASVSEAVTRFFSGVGTLLGQGPPARPQRNHWDAAKSRLNTMILAQLRTKQGDRASAKTFCVATYHMPCMFYAPKVMVIHTALALQKVQSFSKGHPCILAGDFNFKPEDSCYGLATSGTLDASDATYPEGDEANAGSMDCLFGMQSAYATKLGAEPEFTNLARIRDDPVFCATLDYIFCSPGMQVKDVVALPKREDIEYVLPTPEYPSDHLLLGATFNI